MFTLQFNTQTAHAQEVATRFPKDLQLYPRNINNNEAVVPLSGLIDADTYTQIDVEVYRDGELWYNVRQEISADQNSYNYEVSIRAELAEYQFYLYGTKHNDERILLKFADRVVAGDAFLIHGQSNAVGTGTSDESGIKPDRHRFSRTFGSTVLDETVVQYQRWHEAQTRLAYAEGSTSVWAGRLCFKIIESQELPCATINGAYPGQASSFFLPNVDDRYDLETVYGRLLWRSRESGLQNAYRAIFWYQGEDDGRNAELHDENLNALFQYWAEDFPSLEHTFIIQIRYGCGTIDQDNRVFEIQRQFKHNPNTTVVPTNGIEWYDGCHYDAPGYEILADQIYYPVIEEIYGANQLSNVVAPDILSAKQTSLKEIQLTLDIPDGDELIADDGFHIDFSIIDDRGDHIRPIDGTLVGNVITLTLRQETYLFDANLGYVGGKTYVDLGLDIDAVPRIVNLNGIHLLNFWNEPIKPLFLPTQIDLIPTTAEQRALSVPTILLLSGFLSMITLYAQARRNNPLPSEG